MNKSFTEVEIYKVPQSPQTTDVLAVEEPLEIRLGFSENGVQTPKSISITMRTPANDFELAAGFLFTEGILHSPAQIANIEHCGTLEQGGFENVVRVDLADGVSVDFQKLERHFYTSSSCGVCGKSSIAALQVNAQKIESNLTIKANLIHQLPEILRESQTVFEATGGLHASALFDENGNLDIVREDVGRHNALDKVIGAKFLANETPLSNRVLLVSGRASFELVQKALMAQIPILAAVGSPSSLAVELAQEFGMTLVGFVRDGRYNIYTGAERIK